LRQGERLCGYSSRFIKDVARDVSRPKTLGPSRGNIFLPYAGEKGYEVKRILESYGFTVYFKNSSTLGQILTHVKDVTPKEEQAGVVYKITCADGDCTYIGETGRCLKKRINEHHAALKYGNTNSAIAEHSMYTKHAPDLDNTTILCKEKNLFKRKIKEAAYIDIVKQQDTPLINRDSGIQLDKSFFHLVRNHVRDNPGLFKN